MASQQTSQSTQTSGGSSQSSTAIVPGMLDVYNQLLRANQGVYRNVLNAYTNGINAVGQQLPGIVQGYGNLWGNVRDTLGLSGGGWGVAAPAARDIQRTYAQSTGALSQRLTSAGLGNTTVTAALQRGVDRDATDAYGRLGAQLAQLGAGYQSQFGQQALAARMQGLGLQTGLSQSLGGTLGQFRYANTAGDLTGQYSSSNNMSRSTSTSQGTSAEAYGYGGGRGGGGGGSSSSGQSAFGLFGDPLANSFNNRVGYSGAYGYGGFGVPYGAYGDPGRFGGGDYGGPAPQNDDPGGYGFEGDIAY